MAGQRRNLLVSLALLILVVTGVFIGWKLFPDQPSDGVSAVDGVSDSVGHTLYTPPQEKFAPAIARHMERLDPRSDGWRSEAVSTSIDQQLRKIWKSLASAPDARRETLSTVSATSFIGQMTENLTVRYEGNQYRVEAPDGSSPQPSQTTDSLNEFVNLFAQLNTSSPMGQASSKVVQVQEVNGHWQSRVIVELFNHRDKTQRQIHSIWQCTWQTIGVEVEELALKLSRVVVKDYQQAESISDASPLFVDQTAAVFGDSVLASEQFSRDTIYWCERLTGINDAHLFGHNGIAIGDVNGDRLDDLYICDTGGLPNRLFVQQPDGTALDFSKASGANWLESSTSALLVDLDNDGDQDLVVATIAAIIFASNDGQGHFTIRSAHTTTREAHSLAAADYDLDGALDIYACNYGSAGAAGGKRGFEAAVPVPYNDANNGGSNALLNNQGNFRFDDVTERVGLNQNNQRWSFAAAWEDFDHDGDADLYVANDFGRNNLYENQQGKFADIAQSAGVEDMAGGMSVSWGDFNRDGRMDLYVGNMFSAAGNRVTFNRRFLETSDPRRVSSFQRMARGNTLFKATGENTFIDDTESMGVAMGRWAWSSLMVDLNNNGWHDLVVANGYFSNQKPDDL